MHVPPGAADPQNVQHTVEKTPVVASGSRPSAPLRRQQRADQLPFLVRQVSAAHDCSPKSSLQSELRPAGNPFCQHGLSQLQDIGGARIIVENNNILEEISKLIDNFLESSQDFKLHRNTDYRPYGRDDSGYRAFHKIITFSGIKLELQLRTRAQHYWAECIERTSVFYGRRLKEGEGDNVVIRYFKTLSNAFSVIEEGYDLYQESIQNLSDLRDQSESIIRRDGHANLLDGSVNDDVVKTLVQIEKSHPTQVNNWILVFDWRSANFVTWDIVSLDPSEAVEAYSRYERDFPEDNYYEVVLIGSSDVATVQKTHSHYFGISSHDKILENFGQSVSKITDDAKINSDAIKILSRMNKKKIFGMNKGIQRQTLKNHFCKDVNNFEQALDTLIALGYVISKGGAGITLDISKINEIQQII